MSKGYDGTCPRCEELEAEAKVHRKRIAELWERTKSAEDKLINGVFNGTELIEELEQKINRIRKISLNSSLSWQEKHIAIYKEVEGLE
jgi:wobble nucleotide-excising tRNase